jgi:4-amino-4-deoxy-L-arabinose transferase-like glycosyltransferase
MANPFHDWRTNGWLWACLVGIVFASGVRLWRLDFDLPEIQDVDAGKFVGAADQILKSGDLKPYDFQYPTGYTNLLALLYKVVGLHATYGQHLTARLVSVVGGIGMVVAAGWLALRLSSWCAACFAVWLTALSVECVTVSHVACTDTLIAGFMTLALAVAISPQPSRRNWLIAGALVGLAAGTKFSGACIGPTIVLAAIVNGVRTRQWKFAARDAALVCVAAVLAFWLTTPRFPWDASEYLTRLRYEGDVQRFGQIGHVQFGWFDYWLSHTVTPEQPWLSTSMLGNLGPVVLLTLLVALLLALAGRAGQGGVIVGLYMVSYLAIITGPGHLKAARFLLPILPALFALVGWSCAELLTRVTAPRRRSLLAATMLVALVAWPAYRTLGYLALLRQPSTNTLIREWVTENVPQGAKFFASPFYVGDLWSLPIQPLTFSDAWRQQYRLPEEVGLSSERTPIYSPQVVAVMLQNGIEYVVLNSYFEDSLAPTPENLRWFPNSVAAYQAFRVALEARGERVAAIAGYTAGRYGPDITIYRLRP